MTTREKILVFAAGAAVLYGVSYWIGTAARSPVARAGAGAAARGAAAGQPADLESDLNVLRRLESEWAPDPFAAKPLKFGEAAVKPGGTEGYLYSGCVEAGGVYVAFINGLDYRVGDEIAPGGYVVENIDRASVVLRQRDGSGKITVPISEESVR
jgi:hypothetical protein